MGKQSFPFGMLPVFQGRAVGFREVTVTWINNYKLPNAEAADPLPMKSRMISSISSTIIMLQ